MNPNKKYYSKYYLGLCKQYAKYMSKPEVMRKPLFPQIISYNEVTDEYEPLTQNFLRKSVNNTTLNQILSRGCNHRELIKSKYSWHSKNKEGKYILSLEGKQILRKKKIKKEQKKLV